MSNDAIDFAQVKRVLVIKLRHHGDVLLTSPVFSALKQHAPHLDVDALVYDDTKEMITLHPDVSQVFTIDRKWKQQGVWRQLKGEWNLLKSLRARHYDLVIHLTEHKRGAWITRLLKPRWAVVRSGVKGKLFDKTFTHRYPVIGGNKRHTVELHLDALRRIGVFPAMADRRLRLVPGEQALKSLSEKLMSIGVGSEPFVVVHPASRWFFKCWPSSQMAELINQLISGGIKVVLTAAPSQDELAMISAIQAQLVSPVVSLAGQLSLKELAAVIAQAKLFIGVDSVPMHIAAAVQTPCVALFGPSGDIEWGPWQVPHRIVTQSMPCRPCGKDGCGGSKRSECLETIEAPTVMQAVKSLLEETA